MKPVSKTAFYCCGVRAADAKLDKPICGDMLAHLFMNEHGRKVFAATKRDARANQSNVARHRIIDDLLRERLRENPHTAVILIGAGFDTRAYRLGGGRWTELDEPQVIDYKNERLPVAQCHNTLQRIPIDFQQERLVDKLPEVEGEVPVVVVVEGVFIYLEDTEIAETCAALRTKYPRHTLICDLVTQKFVQRASQELRNRLREMGATFKTTAENPSARFLRAGYRLASKTPIVLRAIELSRDWFAYYALKLFLREVAMGYAIYVFETP